MANLTARARALQFVALVALPTGLAIVLNALVRPALAARFDGVRQQSYTNYRSFDGWWEFDGSVQAAHPTLTGFLGMSDGAIAMTGLTCSVVLLLALLLRDRHQARSRA